MSLGYLNSVLNTSTLFYTIFSGKEIIKVESASTLCTYENVKNTSEGKSSSLSIYTEYYWKLPLGLMIFISKLAIV